MMMIMMVMAKMAVGVMVSIHILTHHAVNSDGDGNYNLKFIWFSSRNSNPKDILIGAHFFFSVVPIEI